MATPWKQGANDKPKYRLTSLCKELLKGAALSCSYPTARTALGFPFSKHEEYQEPSTHYIGTLLERLRGPRAFRAESRTAAEPSRESGWNLP